METVRIKYKEKEYEYPKGTTLFDIAKDFQKDFSSPIVLALFNGKLREIFHTAEESGRIDFEDLSGHSGHKAYKRSACLLLIKSFYDVIGRESVERLKVERETPNQN